MNRGNKMENINQLRQRLWAIRSQQTKCRKKYGKYTTAELYMKDRLAGMTYTAIAKKYGVSHQAVSKACARYRLRMMGE